MTRAGKKIAKHTMTDMYVHLDVPDATFVKVNECYRTTYGGPLRSSGLDLNIATSPNKARSAGLSYAVKKVHFAEEADVEGPHLSAVEVGESARGREVLIGTNESQDHLVDTQIHMQVPSPRPFYKDSVAMTPYIDGEWAFLMTQELACH